MLEQLLDIDTGLFLFLNNLGNETWDGFWWLITQNWAPIPLYCLLLYLIYKNYGMKGTIIAAVTVGGMIVVTDQTAGIFKHGICRPRPCQVDQLVENMRPVFVNCGRYGFFSAHGASATAAAVFLGLCLRKWYPLMFWFLMLWAVVTGYSRIYLGVHYPLDVLAGMAFGGTIGWAFYRIQCIGQKRYNPKYSF